MYACSAVRCTLYGSCPTFYSLEPSLASMANHMARPAAQYLEYKTNCIAPPLNWEKKLSASMMGTKILNFHLVSTVKSSFCDEVRNEDIEIDRVLHQWWGWRSWRAWAGPWWSSWRRGCTWWAWSPSAGGRSRPAPGPAGTRRGLQRDQVKKIFNNDDSEREQNLHRLAPSALLSWAPPWHVSLWETGESWWRAPWCWALEQSGSSWGD